MEELKWYVAEFVVAVDLEGDIPHEYEIQNYIIKAHTDEDAYKKAVKVMDEIDHSYENEFGEIQNYKCIGFHNLDEHTLDAHNGDVIHISNVYLYDVDGNPPKPRVRQKSELFLFLT